MSVVFIYSLKTRTSSTMKLAICGLCIFITFFSSVVLETDVVRIQNLTCQPGDIFDYEYESDTKLWGPLNQHVKITADVVIKCVSNENDGSSKLMGQILRIEPRIIRDSDKPDITIAAVVSAATEHPREKRTVGDWFKDAWKTIKEFFVNLFSRKRSSDGGVSASDSNHRQCRQGRSEGKDLPQWTASSVPKHIYDEMFLIPFEFKQSPTGKIEQVFFSEKDRDVTVKNFKKHIVDSLATQVTPEKSVQKEKSPLGEHMTRYEIDNNIGDGGNLKLAGTNLVNLARRVFHDGKSQKGKEDSSVNVIRDVFDQDVIQVGDSHRVIHDPDHVDLKVQQIQKVSDGHISAAVGELTLNLLNPNLPSKRIKRSARDDELDQLLKVHTQYALKLRPRKGTRSKRESSEDLDQLIQLEKKLKFKEESIVASTAPGYGSKEKLLDLRERLASILFANHFNRKFFDLKQHHSPWFETLIEILDLEFYHEEDRKEDSVSHLFRHLPEKELQSNCGSGKHIQLKECNDILVILVKAASDKTIQLLTNAITVLEKQEDRIAALKILSHVQRPSPELIFHLLRIYKDEKDIEIKGHILLTTTSLASLPHIDHKTKTYLFGILYQELKSTSCSRQPGFYTDLLEAIGNFGDKTLGVQVIGKAGECKTDSFLVASVHGIRKHLADPKVQSWLLNLLVSPQTNCVVKQEIVDTLSSDISTPKFRKLTETEDDHWPKKEFNAIDEYLTAIFNTSSCLHSQIGRYFSRKSHERAKLFMKEHSSEVVTRSARSLKHDFWDETYCKEFDGKSKNSQSGNGIPVVKDDGREERTSISEKEETPFILRRKCTAFKYLGPKLANANIRADIVSDLLGSESNPEFKMLAAFTLDSHFLGKDVDVGRMFMYQKNDSTRAYLNIFGRTLLDTTRHSCDSHNGQPYRYSTFIPLFDFNVWMIQMSLGLRFNAEMALNPVSDVCVSKKSSRGLLLSPEATLRTGGEATAQVMVVKGGVDVGGDFNYFSDVEFVPNPKVCLTAFTGHQPMNVSIQSWYSFWDVPCNEWMQRSIWRPKTLNWQIAERRRSPWIDNECLLETKVTGRSNEGKSNFDP